MAEIYCRHFNGYKPCGRNSENSAGGEGCNENCSSRDLVKTRILFIHLGAIGAVVRSTALLCAIRKKYAGCHLTWVTQAPADALLRGHPLIDRVLTTARDDMLMLSALEFDVGFCVDKSLVAAGVLKQTQVGQMFGFIADERAGAIVPATPAAENLWHIGLSNQKKFFENTRPETELVAEALDLTNFDRDEYDLRLSDRERQEVEERRRLWAKPDQLIVGLNTGCSDVIPYKKLPVESQRQLVTELSSMGYSVVLLGGPEDAGRNQRIAHGLPAIESPATRGLRDGLVSVAACDIVVTGDSLGMHLAIAMKKWVVAWFGPTCAHEIDLYDRGVKVLTSARCSPCWSRACHKSPMCYDLVDLQSILAGVARGASQRRLSNRIFGRCPSDHTAHSPA